MLCCLLAAEAVADDNRSDAPDAISLTRYRDRLSLNSDRIHSIHLLDVLNVRCLPVINKKASAFHYAEAFLLGS